MDSKDEALVLPLFAGAEDVAARAVKALEALCMAFCIVSVPDMMGRDVGVSLLDDVVTDSSRW